MDLKDLRSESVMVVVVLLKSLGIDRNIELKWRLEVCFGFWWTGWWMIVGICQKEKVDDSEQIVNGDGKQIMADSKESTVEITTN